MADIVDRLSDWPVPAIQEAILEIRQLRTEISQLRVKLKQSQDDARAGWDEMVLLTEKMKNLESK